MRWRLRPGTGLVAVTALALTPVLGGSQAALVDANPQPVAGWVDVLPNLPEDEGLDPHPPVPQQIAPQVTLVAKDEKPREIRLEGPRGRRVWAASALTSHDLPQAAMDAYKRAAATMAGTDPSCQLPWTLLAGIGRVESDHGRYGGSVLSTDGVSRPAIIGIALDGRGPVAAIRDSDDGRMDQDKVWDRAVGPMQFIPSTWSWSGRDGDGDGKVNPHDIDDTALAAAAYLCSGSGSMLDDGAAKAAIFRYNPSDYYVALVQAFERGYRTGMFVLPSPPPPPGEDDGPKKHRRKAGDRDRASQSGTTSTKPKPTPKPAAEDEPSPKPSPTPSPKPSPKPSPSPSPSPSPDPSPSGGLTLVTLSGSLAACDGWCVGSTKLDLGPDAQLGGTAAHDFDGDGTTESMTDELTGMEGTAVTLRVGGGTTPAVVYVIDGVDYRLADGTFA